MRAGRIAMTLWGGNAMVGEYGVQAVREWTDRTEEYSALQVQQEKEVGERIALQVQQEKEVVAQKRLTVAVAVPGKAFL